MLLDADGKICHVTDAMQAVTSLRPSDKGFQLSTFRGSIIPALNKLRQDALATQNAEVLYQHILHNNVACRLGAAPASFSSGMVLTFTALDMVDVTEA